jgi:hypothetical protein
VFQSQVNDTYVMRPRECLYHSGFGQSCRMTEPQPSYSAYREASFGHGILDIKNRTHAYYGWNRNQDGYAVEDGCRTI